MNSKKMKFLATGLILIATSIVSCGQSKQDKIDAIIKKMNLIEDQKINYDFEIESLKFQATGNDSIRIVELENKMQDNEIAKRISLSFNKIFSDKEINDIYNFIQTAAFEKFFKSEETFKAIDAQFEDIQNEIEEIAKSVDSSLEKQENEFNSNLAEKEDGFYETADYSFSTEDNDIKLAASPALTSKDILDIKKTKSKYNNKRSEINIELTKEGAEKFYLFTKENIGKTIAIVINHQIVYKPRIQTEIEDGKITIMGDFSDEEIDKMIDRLKRG